MADPTEVYVDPNIAADSGAGTSGDPYGDIQYALNQVTRDSTNGNRFNIKSGTDEILSAALDLDTYGPPAFASPLVFQGYTSTAGDGGIGGISGNGTYGVWALSVDGVHFANMHCHNCGSANILDFGAAGNYCTVSDCEINNSSGDGVFYNTNYGTVQQSNIHDIGGFGVRSKAGANIANNYFANGTKKFSVAIRLGGTGDLAFRNVISIGGTSVGIDTISFNNRIISNSILSVLGSVQGILIKNGSVPLNALIINNLVEGFTETGGIGIEFAATGTAAAANFSSNGVYDCLTNYRDPDKTAWEQSDNESLGASPFTKSGSDTFANRFTYFSPVNTGNVRGGAYPSGARVDKGAVQHADPAGGGGLLVHPGMRGGLNG